MQTLITDSKDKKFPTRIPAKANVGSLGIAVYVQNVSDSLISKLKLKGEVIPRDKFPRDLTFGNQVYEDVLPGACCLFTDEITIPNYDITLRLTSSYWFLKPLIEGDVRRYGDWVEDDIVAYRIAAVLPPPPPPEFVDITMTFSRVAPTSARRVFIRPEHIR